jgi:hypothetical protein
MRVRRMLAAKPNPKTQHELRVTHSPPRTAWVERGGIRSGINLPVAFSTIPGVSSATRMYPFSALILGDLYLLQYPFTSMPSIWDNILRKGCRKIS